MAASHATDGDGRPVDDPRVAIALGCRVLAATGQSDMILGHVSARDADGRGTWMKPNGRGFEEITPDDAILIDDDGQVLEGSGRRHTEFPIHTEILAARPDLHAVVHTHAVAPVAISAIGDPLLPLSHEGCQFAAPDLPWFDETANLIRTRQLGRAVATTLGSHHSMLLVNHGIATTGADVPSAVLNAVLLDRAANLQLLASGACGIRNCPTPQEAAAKRETVYNEPTVRSMWEYLLRVHGISF